MQTSGHSRPDVIRVWDLFVRIFHWSLISLFLFAYFTGDEWDTAHEWAGYLIMGLLTARIVWGFTGSTHARFRDFVYSPITVLDYLRDSILLKAKRFLGHNPAGGAMVISLIVSIGVICGSGHMMTMDAFWGAGWVEEIHEASVNFTLLLVLLHIAGVILASVEHKENLIRAMITGYKRR